MRNILLLPILSVMLFACENQTKEFDDFEVKGCYFPYQSPIRTIILGEDDLVNNELENTEHKFVIGISMGGVYDNDEERIVDYTVDLSLLDSVDGVQALPSAYYTLEPQNSVTIPVGSTKGMITVQLTDAFFKDSLSISPTKNTVSYVIPLRITDAFGLDSIFTGSATEGLTNPVRTVATDWEILPKDFTLYGIKYINEKHGYYLRRGVDVAKSLRIPFPIVSTDIYTQQDIVDDEVVLLSSTKENSVKLTTKVRRGTGIESPGDFEIELDFDENGDCIIPSFMDGEITGRGGEGQLVMDAETWGGKERDAIYLSYKYIYSSGSISEEHTVNDTLVIRDRGVVFEQFTITNKE